MTSPNAVLERSHSLHNGARRRSSQSSETPSDCSDRLGYHESEAVSRPKVTDRWQHNVQETNNTQKSTKTNSVIHSRGSSCDNSYAHSRGSSYDVRFFLYFWFNPLYSGGLIDYYMLDESVTVLETTSGPVAKCA